MEKIIPIRSADYKPGAPKKKLIPIKPGTAAVTTPKKKKGFGSKVMNVIDKLSIPLYGLVGAVESLAGKGDKKGLWRNIKDNVKQKQGWTPLLKKTGMNSKVASVLGFAGDVVVDPLNLVGLGLVGKAAKGLGYGAKALSEVNKLGLAGRFLEKAALKDTAKGIAKLTRTTSKGLSKASSVEKMEKALSKADTLLNKKSYLGKVAGKMGSKAKTLGEYVPKMDPIVGDIGDTAPRIKTLLKGIEDAQVSTRKSLSESKLIRLTPAMQKHADALSGWLLYKPAALTFEASKLLEADRAKLLTKKEAILAEVDTLVAMKKGYAEKKIPLTADMKKMEADIVKRATKVENQIRAVKSKLAGETPDTLWQTWMRGQLGIESLGNLVQKNPLYFETTFVPKVSIGKTVKNVMGEPLEAIKGVAKEGKAGMKDYIETGFKPKVTNLDGSGNFVDDLDEFGDQVFDASGKVKTHEIKLDTATQAERLLADPAMRKTLEIINAVGIGYAKVLSTWKALKVLPNPGSYPKNYVTNIVFLAWHDPAELADPKFWAAYREAGQILKFGDKHPLYNKLDPYFSLEELSSGALRDIDSVGSTLNAVEDPGIVRTGTNWLKKKYGGIDTQFKMAHVIFRTETSITKNASKLSKLGRGQDILLGPDALHAAAQESNKIFMNYAAMPKLAKVLRDAPFGAPFVSFQYALVHKLGETLVKAPGKLSIPEDVKRAITDMNPVTPEEKAAMKKYDKEYLLDPRYGKLPSIFSKVDPTTGKVENKYFDFKGYIPQYGLTDYQEKNLQTPWGESPFYTIPSSIAKNKDFLGKPIVPKGATKKEKNTAIRKYILEEMLPNLAPGGRFWNKMADPETDKAKKIMSTLGFPSQDLYYYDKDKKLKK